MKPGDVVKIKGTNQLVTIEEIVTKVKEKKWKKKR